jgi:IS1 family transposase
MPSTPTTNSWSFPPRTREGQFDEKWAFVYKKQAHCDPSNPADANRGDYWDHVAFDPEHKLVVSVVPGDRSIENAEAVVADFHRRTGGRVMRLMTTDGYPAYETAILHTYGESVLPPRTGRPGRPEAPHPAVPKGLNYATVEKRREKGRVVEIICRIIFGTLTAVLAALKRSAVSRAINTSFVERYHATDRHRNARKARKTYRFSKDWRQHEAVTYFTIYSYNFCWPVKTLRVRRDDGSWQARTPAMAAGLADHIWTLSEWLKFPVVQRA